MKLENMLNNKPVVNEEQFEDSNEMQKTSVPIVMDIVRELGEKTSDDMVLEFFFYTNELSKAESLTAQLKTFGYAVAIDEQGKPGLNFSITGTTIPLPNEDEVIADWAGKISELGFVHDCEFDGWGTAVMKGGWFSDDTPDEVIRKRLGLLPRED